MIQQPNRKLMNVTDTKTMCITNRRNSLVLELLMKINLIRQFYRLLSMHRSMHLSKVLWWPRLGGMWRICIHLQIFPPRRTPIERNKFHSSKQSPLVSALKKERNFRSLPNNTIPTALAQIKEVHLQ